MPVPLARIVADHFSWEAWEALVAANGVTIDRPYRSAHPQFADIVYPIDYGYVNGTMASDGHEVDIFVGSSRTGLLGTMVTTDHRREDREFKLIYDCSPEEIYLVNGFINFDRRLLDGLLVMRRPMEALWAAVRRGSPGG